MKETNRTRFVTLLECLVALVICHAAQVLPPPLLWVVSATLGLMVLNLLVGFVGDRPVRHGPAALPRHDLARLRKMHRRGDG